MSGLRQPGAMSQRQNVATPGNIAINELTGAGVGATKRQGSVGSVQEICVHLTAASDYSAGAQKIITGAGDTSSTNTGITWGSDSSFSTFAAMQDYFKSNKLVIDSARIATTDTDNWDYKLTIGFRNPNNRNNPEEDRNFQDYAKVSGSGLAKTLEIPSTDLNKLFMPSNYLTLSNMKVSTSIRIYLRVYEMETTADTTPIRF